MFIHEQAHVFFPRALAIEVSDRFCNTIAALERKRSALFTGEPATDGILPVGGVHRELPDVMPARRLTGGRARRAHAAQRSEQRRPMPRSMIECFVDQIEAHSPRVDSHYRCFRIQANTVSCQRLLFNAFRTQCPSSGNTRASAGTPCRRSAVNSCSPWSTGTR